MEWRPSLPSLERRERYISRKTHGAWEPLLFPAWRNIKCFYSLQNLRGALCTYQQEWEFFFFIKNLFLEMFIIKHPVLELLKTMLSKESPNLVNNFKASHDFLQIWVCWKHSKNFISSTAAWWNCVISHPSDAAGEISFCTGQEQNAILVIF